MGTASSTMPFWPSKIVIRKEDAKKGAMDTTQEYKFSEDVGKKFVDGYLKTTKTREYRLIFPESGFPNRTLFLTLMEVAPGEATCLHRHNCEEVFFIVEGKGKVEVEGQLYEVEQGCGVYIPPNAKHRCLNTEKAGYFKYTVSGGVMLHPLPSSPEEAREVGAHDVFYPGG